MLRGIVFAGSRFCTNAEHQYAPIEGEAAAIVWALDKCHIFIMGCTNIRVLGIFGDRDLSKIQNPCLFKLKKKSLRYFFPIQHCPGKWHKGAHAISCNPVATVEALLSLYPKQPSFKDVHLSENIDTAMELATIQAITNSSNDVAAMSSDHIHASS